MGLQLIFVVETNKKCRSDWIYIKDTIDHFFRYNQAQVKFSPVYMEGRGNYKKKEKEISSLISQYASTSKDNQSKVIYCFDCDDYDSKSEDSEFLAGSQRYCNEMGYDFVWFCKDVELVYLGKKVDDSKKKKEAETFKLKKLINNVAENKLSVTSYRANTSNILIILGKYIARI